MGVTKFERPIQLESGRGIEGFSCGNETVDTWVVRYSRTARARGNAVIYASFCEDVVAGFYTLSTYSVSRIDATGGWFARNAPLRIPAVLLGMLGVDRRFQGMGLGAMLLRDAILNARKVAEIAGTRALIVDPAGEEAEKFYGHFGFTKISDSGSMALKLR